MSRGKQYRRHAARRAHERYDLNISKADVNLLAKQARRVCAAGHPTPEGRVIERQSHTRSLLELHYKDRVLRAVFNRPHGVFVTFLPPDP